MSTVSKNKPSRRAFVVAGAFGAALLALAAMSAPAAAEAPSYTVSVSNATAKTGEQTTVVATIAAAEGYHCNKEYPHKAKKLAGEGVEFPGGDTVKGALSGDKVVISIPVKPTTAGAHQVTGEIRFSVCNDSQCVIKKVALAATVTGT